MYFSFLSLFLLLIFVCCLAIVLNVECKWRLWVSVAIGSERNNKRPSETIPLLWERTGSVTMSAKSEMDESIETIVDDSTPTISRAQSNYSTQRTKLLIAPIKYGETRAQYLWRLLRCSIRRTIDAVSRADDTGRRQSISRDLKHVEK